jgi:hypothetical protein
MQWLAEAVAKRVAKREQEAAQLQARMVADIAPAELVQDPSQSSSDHLDSNSRKRRRPPVDYAALDQELKKKDTEVAVGPN